MLYQFQIPKIELVPFSTALLDQFKEMISLKKNLVILLEGAKIPRINLRVCDVQVTATKGWSTSNKVDVLGAKEHYIYLTNEIDGAARNALYPDPLLNMGRILGVCRHKGDLHLKATIPFSNLGYKASHTGRFPWCRPVYQLPLRGGAMGFRGCQQVDCLEEVGLALGIIAMKHHQVRREIELKALIVAEVGQAQVFDKQTSPPGISSLAAISKLGGLEVEL